MDRKTRIAGKRQAHFEALGYEPLRMKPAHFASGFFLALTGRIYANELLNQVAVTKANRGLLEGYAPDAIFQRLRGRKLIADSMTPAAVELLRMQVNGVVNNDSAMYPAFGPYRAKGNDYTFLSPRLLTGANRTDGYAGYFVARVLDATAAGTAVLDFARAVADGVAGTLERFVNPLLADADEAEPFDLAEKYESQYGALTSTRINEIAERMRTRTDGLAHLCRNLASYSHYRRIRYLVLGLLAWLMDYLLVTAAVGRSRTMLFDFVDEKDGPIRSQSRACYARLRETVRRAYLDFAAGGFTADPVADGVFARANRPDEHDFKFLEDHFGNLALRMGYAQPRASNVQQKHFELQPDTLRVLLLTILHEDPERAMTFDDVCGRLRDTWSIVVGGCGDDYEALRRQGYFGFDEADLERNAAAFAERLKALHLAVEPSDGLVLCSRNIGEAL